ncbi:hypothetical protein C7T94_08910 [Pedobacter yulinensis]|uniref:ABC transporter domain-containing protein n=1 Tax=Pedobacter yulinensis TaxID=2126353 RepID=A0A2T3HJW8_9SPHI|nr:ATP-binding cassette domain-containing protein [Pedobacter yulinensis]PST82758.1 hypothetical protein C7T94_08910 [Pedobacter yulinensis]
MRMRISGGNGSGKTTLLNLLTGLLQPQGGQLVRADFSYMYLDQNYSLIRPERTVFDQLSAHNGRNLQEHELRSLLIYAQFPQESWDRKCEALSGGEKMKLSLLCLSIHTQTPDMLLLDEPTNNLDLRSLAVLTASVSTFSGALLLISHDEHFASQVGIEHTIHL